MSNCYENVKPICDFVYLIGFYIYKQKCILTSHSVLSNCSHITLLDITFWSRFAQIQLFPQIIGWTFASPTSVCCVWSRWELTLKYDTTFRRLFEVYKPLKGTCRHRQKINISSTSGKPTHYWRERGNNILCYYTRADVCITKTGSAMLLKIEKRNVLFILKQCF